jgi:adenylate cyclase
MAWIVGIGAAPGDTEDERLAKATLAAVSLLIVPFAAIWGSVYLVVGRPLAAVMPYAYIVVAVAAVGSLRRTRSIVLPRTVVLVSMSVLPFALQWVLGGYGHSGAVSIWALMVPALAFMFGAPPGRWVAVFVALSVVSGIADSTLAERFEPLPQGMIRTYFVINVVAVGVTYFTALRYFTEERSRARAALEAERARSDALLLNVLPEQIAERLKAGEQVIADGHPEVTVLFADIVGFTAATADLPPEQVVAELTEVFAVIDRLVTRFGVERIKTLGDGYEAVCGAPTSRPDHADAVAELALAMREEVTGLPLGATTVRLRIGIDTGPAVGAVIGSHRFSYDLWGDAVNTASRMESHGVPDRIQVTDRFRRCVDGRFRFEPRGEIEVRGKGPMETWFLVGRGDAPRPAG